MQDRDLTRNRGFHRDGNWKYLNQGFYPDLISRWYNKDMSVWSLARAETGLKQIPPKSAWIRLRSSFNGLPKFLSTWLCFGMPIVISFLACLGLLCSPRIEWVGGTLIVLFHLSIVYMESTGCRSRYDRSKHGIVPLDSARVGFSLRTMDMISEKMTGPTWISSGTSYRSFLSPVLHMIRIYMA